MKLGGVDVFFDPDPDPDPDPDTEVGGNRVRRVRIRGLQGPAR
jgi:hypothetical protein